jgi:hypothetical protein
MRQYFLLNFKNGVDQWIKKPFDYYGAEKENIQSKIKVNSDVKVLLFKETEEKKEEWVLYLKENGVMIKDILDEKEQRLLQINLCIEDAPKAKIKAPMTPRVRTSSKEAHEKLLVSGKELELCELVYQILLADGGDMTCAEIASRASEIQGYFVQNSTISPRISTLKKEGKVVEVPKRKCSLTDNTVNCVVAV